MSDRYQHLVGRVGIAPERKTTTAGELAEFRLAVDGPYDAATKSRPTTWYDVTAWEPMATLVMDKFGVGSRVWVAGDTSVFHGTSGDRNKVKAREVGLVEKLIPQAATNPSMYPASSKAAPKAAAPAGVTYGDDDGDDW